MTKRILALVLALIMVLSLMPVVVGAETVTASPKAGTHTVAGHSAECADHCAASVTWTAWDGDRTKLVAGGHYYLTKDTVLTGEVEVAADLHLCLNGYVLTAAKNAALLLLPKQQQRDNTLDITELNIQSKDDLFQQVVNSLDYDLLLRAMRQLDPLYRDVLMMVYVQEQSVEATADILQRKKETVRKQLQRGKKLLIELCGKEGMYFGQDQIEAV